jgi:uncharacterized protein YjdB
LTACKQLTGSFSNVVAIAYTGPTAPTVEVGDTIRLTAHALDAAGDSVPDAAVTWAVLELDTVRVGFSLDSTTGLITGLYPGSGRVVAAVENLQTDPITVTVTARPDSIALAGSPVDTVGPGAVASSPLETVLWDLTTTPGTSTPIAGKTVTYRLVDPAPGTAAAQGLGLAPAGGTVGADTTQAAVVTNGNGIASAELLILGSATPPDSAVVEAGAVTALGDTVPGSPVRFVVYFITQ